MDRWRRTELDESIGRADVPSLKLVTGNCTVPFRPSVQSRVTDGCELNTLGVSSRVTGRREHLIGSMFA
jgi:hypothetical protein